MTGFDPQAPLVGPVLRLDPLAAEDFEALRGAAADPSIWAGHPARDRHERAAFRTYFDMLLERGTALVIREADSQRVVGCTAWYVAPDAPDDVSIGFTFLTPDHWGGATNMALKTLMLDHAFAHFDAVWFHIDPANRRSQRATAKLGAVHRHDAVLTLGAEPAEWRCYRLDRAGWEAARG